MKKYVVIYEIPDTGYMGCVGICDTAVEAYGEAYLALSDGLERDEYFITTPVPREGENGFIMEVVSVEDKSVQFCATVLIYEDGKNG